MKSINLKMFPMKSANEIFQSLDIKFSFVNSKYEQVSNPIKCRDFLGDVIFSRVNGTPVSIYGFSYNYNTAPYDTNKTRISMRFPDKKNYNYFLSNFSKLNDLEKMYKLSQSRILFTQDKETIVVEGSKLWQTAPWKISLYTFLLKLYSYKDTQSLEDPESGYYKTLDGKLGKLMSKIKTTKANWYDDIGHTHNYSGFVSVIRGNSNMSKMLGF